MNYLQHRISYHWDVAKQLFASGYLTIGWQGLSHTEILNEARKYGEDGFEKCAAKYGLTERNRKCLYRFFMMEPGDVVVVPLLYEKAFAIVEISGFAKPIQELGIESLKSVSGKSVIRENSLVYKDNGSIIDIGFFIPFNKENVSIVRRAFASAQLQSSMTWQRLTNVYVNKLSDDIKAARCATAPLDLHDVILESAAPKILDAIHKLTPDSFEYLVKWYMEQSGASNTFIPPKNERKEDGADADVVAEFSSLGIVFFIQAKKHKGNTDDWAIKQISQYKEQKENKSDDFTYIPWVVTTATFQEKVKEYAHEVGVRLIDGETFAKMILDTGVNSINEVIERLR